jgi:hypothetical protein
MMQIDALVKKKGKNKFQVSDLPDCTNHQLMRKWKEKGWVRIIGNTNTPSGGGGSIRIWALTDKAIMHIKAYKEGKDLPRKQISGYN